MAGIQPTVDYAIATGTQKVFVSTVLPRPGSIYDYILPDLNALIMAGGSGNFTPVDLYVSSCLATIPGPCYADSGGHPSALGHQAVADIWYPIVTPWLH
jgi:lysophospholipase L1-like esterase